MEISYHVSGWAVFDAHFAIGNYIDDKIVSDIDIPGMLAAGSLAVVFEFDGTIVVLVTDIIFNIFSLCLQKYRHQII